MVKYASPSRIVEVVWFEDDANDADDVDDDELMRIDLIDDRADK